MRSFRPRRHQKPPLLPTWDNRLSPSPPKTAQQLAELIIATNPLAFRTITALVAAMRKVNDDHRLGFLAVSIREAASFAVRADARGLSPAHDLIIPRDNLDHNAAQLAWTALGSSFLDGVYTVETIWSWMTDMRRKLLHEAVEYRKMPVIVGHAEYRADFFSALLGPLDGFYRHLRAATISPPSILSEDELGTVPVAVVDIKEGDRLDMLRFLSSSPTMTLPGMRSPIKVPVETSFIGVADADVAGCDNLVLLEPCGAQLRIDYKLLWRSA